MDKSNSDEEVKKSSMAAMINQKQEGVKEAMRMLGSGKSRVSIVEILQEKYGISSVTSYKWFNAAASELLPQSEEDANHIRADIAAAINYAQMSAIRTLQTVRDGSVNEKAQATNTLMAVIDRRTKLFGLNREQGAVFNIVNNVQNNTHVITKSSERRRQIEELLRELPDDPEAANDDGDDL
jgi:hypothetical protein